MRRLPMGPRANLAARTAELGFAFHAEDGVPYWDETACYAFSLEQVERDLEAPAAELAEMALALVERAVRDAALLARLGIPGHAHDLVAASWRRRDPTLYGRFDLSYGGTGPAKLLEYNADTPTALYEAAVFQWVWLEDLVAQGALPAAADQFNRLHEALVARLAEIGRGEALHVAGLPDSAEDRGFLAYLADCARQAGLPTTALAMADIGVDAAGRFVDRADAPIRRLFKLYPWEWLFADPFAQKPGMAATRFLEPPWKAVLSSKGMLPLLWAMAPGHPNLLEAYFEDDPAKAALGARFARKPLLSREGANVLLVDGDRVLDRDEGPYGAEGFVRQALAPLPDFDGNRPVLGLWIVGEAACGLGIREDRAAITRNGSRFVPHAIL